MDPLNVDNMACPVKCACSGADALGRGTFVEDEVDDEFDN